jgi:hypothetical protein
LGSQEWEVGLCEAESSLNLDLVMAAAVERGADSRDLSLEPVDEHGAVAATDEQPRFS